MSDFKIVPLTARFVPRALELCRLAGWNQLESDWLRLIELEPEGCFALLQQDRLVGTVTTTRYDRELAWIGMMLVHPDFRRMGLATRLMNQSLSYLESRNTKCIKLDATPTGQRVYEQLGFNVEWQFRRWTKSPNEARRRDIPGDLHAKNATGSREALQPDKKTLPGLSTTHFELDLMAFGANRSRLLERTATMDAFGCLASQGQSISSSHMQNPGSIRERVVNICTRPSGYGMLRAGHLASYLGPVVAETDLAASEIIHELIAESEREIFWDIPSPNKRAIELALALGFRPDRELARMHIGEQPTGPKYKLQYAMFDPSVG